MGVEKNIVEQIKQIDSTLIQGDKNIVLNIKEVNIHNSSEKPNRKKEPLYFPRRRINEISCDRREIMQIFRSHFDHEFKINPPPFYFFTLPSFPEQQANSLIERMTYELSELGHGDRKVFYLQDNDNFKFIDLPMGINDKNNKYVFRQRIFTALNLSFPSGSLVTENNFMLKDLKGSLTLEDYHFVTFAFKLNAEELTKKYVFDFIEWFVTEFNVRSDNSPVFIFFLQLEIPVPKIEGWRKFVPLFSTRESKLNPALLNLESLRTKSKHFIMLPFLDSINLREVGEYLSHYIPNDIERYDMIRENLEKTYADATREQLDKTRLPMSKGELIIKRILIKLQQEHHTL